MEEEKESKSTQVDVVSEEKVTVLTQTLPAHINPNVATAKAYPRQEVVALAKIKNIIKTDYQTALECIYSMPRGKKPIRGASVRFAEILATRWGNCRFGSRPLLIDRVNKTVTAEGSFIDHETNSQSTVEVTARISDRHGKIYSDDMINVTMNAACAKARRNAILAGIPKTYWRDAYDAAERVIRGDEKSITETRDNAIKAFSIFGITEKQLFELLEVESLNEIQGDEIVTLRGIYSALQNGETTVDEVLRNNSITSAHEVIADPLNDTIDPEKMLLAEAMQDGLRVGLENEKTPTHPPKEYAKKEIKEEWLKGVQLGIERRKQLSEEETKKPRE